MAFIVAGQIASRQHSKWQYMVKRRSILYDNGGHVCRGVFFWPSSVDRIGWLVFYFNRLISINVHIRIG